MEYPYIANNNLMFYAKGTATFVGDEDNLNTHGFKITANESKFTNITREYLEGKCVKIESPEHGEFVQKLAFNAGYFWAASSFNVRDYDVSCLYFKDKYLSWGDEEDLNSTNEELITIPLPPKAESKEWPVIGDTVTWGKGVDNSKLLAVHEGSAWVVMQTDGHNDYGVIPVRELKKPKTEAEILRDELIELAFNQFNDDSHPLDRNAYYLISELMDKYNITKKV